MTDTRRPYLKRGLVKIAAAIVILVGGGLLMRSGIRDVTYVEKLDIASAADVGIDSEIQQTRQRASAIDLADLNRNVDTTTHYLDLMEGRFRALKEHDALIADIGMKQRREFDGHGKPFLPGAVHYVADWEFTHRDARGNVIWHETIPNALVDVGEQRLLEVYFKDASEPTTFYISLSDASNPCSIAETDSLSTANTGEPSGNGYARGTVERSATGWPTSALDSGDWQLTSSTETFTASGAGWGPVNCAVLQTSTDNTGDHLAFVALSQARTLAASETLDVSLKVKLQ